VGDCVNDVYWLAYFIKKHHKPVISSERDGIYIADASLYSGSNVFQDSVSRYRPHAFVFCFDRVEIQAKDGNQTMAITSRPCHGTAQAVNQKLLVRKACERVEMFDLVQ